MGNTYQVGDFIKPDPYETDSRQTILNELEHCLANVLSEPEDIPSFNKHLLHSFLLKQSWPQGRLYHIRQLLEEGNMFDHPGEVAFKIIQHVLCEYDDELPYSKDIVQLALGFIQVDILPNGRTIESYWKKNSELNEPSRGTLWNTPVAIPVNILVYICIIHIVWLAVLVGMYTETRTRYPN